MSKFESIIVPLGGSAFAEQALPLALAIAAGGPATLLLMRAHESASLALARGRSGALAGRRDTEDLAYLDAVAARQPRTNGVAVETHVVRGRPAEAICEVADSHRRALIVMASHGRTGTERLWLGSIMDTVLRRAQTAVLAIRTAENDTTAPPTRIQKILVPLDGSRTAQAILPHAVALAEMCGAALELLRVVVVDDVAPPVGLPTGAGGDDVVVARHDLHQIADRLRADAPGVSVHTRVILADNPASIIIAAAKMWGCDMVAMTTRAAGLTRLIIGSVADQIIRGGPPLLLLVRPDAR